MLSGKLKSVRMYPVDQVSNVERLSLQGRSAYDRDRLIKEITHDLKLLQTKADNLTRSLKFAFRMICRE